MLNVVDQTGDLNGQQLYRLTKLYPLPSFVKRASSETIYGTEDLENHQFSDREHRQFPCHTAPATYVSTLFFLDKRAEMDPGRATVIESRLDDFAFLHGIQDSIKQLKEKLASANTPTTLDDLPDDHFALILPGNETPSGKQERYYPLRNPLEIKKCAEYVKEYTHEFHYKYRQKMAEAILNRADACGAGLGDLDAWLEKTAGRGGASSVDISNFLTTRSRLLKRAGHQEFAAKLSEVAQMVTKRPESVYDQDQRVKLACLIDDIDRETGLSRLIEDLPRPEMSFFNLTEKSASALRMDHVVTKNGNFYKLADLDKLQLRDVRDFMGEDFAEAISAGGLFVSSEKLAGIVPTLPRNDADLFERLLRSCGIQPIAKEAAHEHAGFDEDELRTLASIR